MTRLAITCLLLCACAMPATAQDRHASQWPLSSTFEEAGAYRVELDASVYRQALAADLRDVDVVDADGRPVPAQLVAAGIAPTMPPRRVALRWFALPQPARNGGDDVSLQVTRDGAGRVLRVDAAARGDDQVGAADDASWLVDASRLDQAVQALHLQWRDGEPLDRGYSVEASDDLRQWRSLGASARLVDLSRDGERLRLQRVPVAARAKYFRLRPESGVGRVALVQVDAELGPTTPAPQLQWQSLRAESGAAAEPPGYRFLLDGRFPVESVDLGLEDNGAGEWRLYSRDAADAPWQLRAGPWVAYRIGNADAAERSAPQPLGLRVRDREWKLVGSGGPPRTPPQLLLGWRPDVLVFVAEGPAPYRLVAGSARAARIDAPVARSLDAIRSARGRGWQPAVAQLGAMQPLAGARALQSTPRDWRGLLLWALLVAGALVVLGFAMSLLRQQSRGS